MRRRLTIHTVGCKSNFADSGSIAREAVAAGFDVVPAAEPADVVIVNSCTVTHRADRDSRALIRRARRANPGALVVMTGCYAQNSPQEMEKLPEVDRWIGIGDPGALAALLGNFAGTESRGPARISDHASDLLLGHRRTFLKIQDGCDFSCAYCVVPLVRGKNRSLPRSEVLEKAVAAENDGAREIVLTGIHAGLYGADRGEKEALTGLLTLLLRESSHARIRLGSIEPTEVTNALLDAMACNQRVCRHLHIPLQSGSDRTLSRMRRPYDARKFEETVFHVASVLPGVQIGSDVIAGFPGETRDDFDETVRLLECVPVNYLHVFPYSSRPGTESAGWPDDVSPREKKERVSHLLQIDKEKRAAFIRKQVGAELEVLAETAHPGRGELSGYSGNYLEVSFPGESSEIGGLHRIRVTSARNKGLAGQREERDV